MAVNGRHTYHGARGCKLFQLDRRYAGSHIPVFNPSSVLVLVISSPAALHATGLHYRGEGVAVSDSSMGVPLSGSRCVIIGIAVADEPPNAATGAASRQLR